MVGDIERSEVLLAPFFQRSIVSFAARILNIRVNSIAPCIFWSDLTAPMLNDPVNSQKYTVRIPLGRAARPEDFIGAVIFLASDASAMVTAHILSVDGGVVGG